MLAGEALLSLADLGQLVLLRLIRGADGSGRRHGLGLVDHGATDGDV